MERHAFAEDVADHQRHMLYRKRMAQAAKAHAASGGETHLAVLKMKSRIREQIEIAGVIVMQVRHDNTPDRVGTDTEACQCLHRIERELAVAQAGLRRVETRIDQNIAAVASDQPDEIVEIGSR